MSDDIPDDRIQELLERWDALRHQGEPLSAEELCEDCPELVDEVRRRIEALKATNWLDKPVDDIDDRLP